MSIDAFFSLVLERSYYLLLNELEIYMNWFENLIKIKSLGSKAKRPGSLAGLHDARKEHLSQFFTPKKVTDLMWSIIENNDGDALGKISLIDNSCGNGAMFFNANPEKHKILGCDVHADSVDALSLALKEAGFDYNILNCGMEDLQVEGEVDVCLLNPPFSIHLESPALVPYECTTFGRFGSNSSAVSHEYALAQALDCANVVMALLPMNQVVQVIESNNPRLCAVYELPMDAFIEQGVRVKTAVCVFGHCYESFELIREKIDSDYSIEQYPNILIGANYSRRASIRRNGTSLAKPTITLPVTGNKEVKVTHKGRKIKLGFSCGFVQAQVENAILVARARSGDKKRRLANFVNYTGQGSLDLQLHLMQTDPNTSIYINLIDIINNNGGCAKVDSGLLNFIRKNARKVKRALVPFSRVIYQDGNTIASAKYQAINDVLIIEGAFVSPVVSTGMIIDINCRNDRFYCQYEGVEYELSEGYISQNFKNISIASESGFVTKYEGKGVKYPHLLHEVDVRAKRLGLNRMLWDYQYNDLLETTIHPTGSIVGWDMGLGKTRFAIAAILLSNVKHGLIVVKAGLIPEFLRQIKEDLSEFVNFDDVNVISDLQSVTNLKQINIISYNKLYRSPTANKRKPYAKLLKRRCGLVIADEAHLLSNYHTQQSRAVRMLCAKKLIAMTGTAIPNYARNIHPVLVSVSGDATAYNNWGIYNGRLEKHHIRSMNDAYTGIKEFLDTFVTMEWCTYEFEDDTRGAKREIPKIKNVALYREMLAPHFKRRVTSEPDCAKYVQLPVPEIRDIFIDWDMSHLEHYYKVCRNFAGIWKNRHKDKKSIASILPRINAVLKACNRPFVLDDNSGDIGVYLPPTSKDVYCCERLIQWVSEGKKAIYFVNSPDNVQRMSDMLISHGIKSVKYTGQENIKQRMAALEDDFKHGDVDVLLATKGCASEGLNIPQSSRILCDSSWNSKIEDQAIARVLRKGQLDDVVVERVHIKGSIDEYQRQMTEFKRDACRSGLDFGDSSFQDEEFLHMETIINRFIDGLDDLQQEMLKNAA